MPATAFGADALQTTVFIRSYTDLFVLNAALDILGNYLALNVFGYGLEGAGAAIVIAFVHHAFAYRVQFLKSYFM